MYSIKNFYHEKIIFSYARVLGYRPLALRHRNMPLLIPRYILDKMPEYAEAQKQLDDIAQDWQNEIDTKQAALDKMYKDYEAEQVMLPDELKKKREDQLFIKEKELRIFNANALVLKVICLKKDRN